MDIKLRTIMGVIILIIVFLPIFILLNYRKRQMKQLDKLAHSNTDLKQKVRIIKSRNIMDVNSNKSNVYKTILFIAILILGTFCLFNFDCLTDIARSKFLIIFLLLVLIIYIVILKLKDKKIDNGIKLFIKDNLEKKYNNIMVLPTHSKKIVEGNKSEEGNIRNIYLFSYNIEMYNCNLVCYYQEKLVSTTYNNGDTSYKYFYKRIGCFLEYSYNVSKSKLDNLNNINEIFLNLYNTKIMNVELLDNHILIKKETVLYGYNNYDADIDTDDVKTFYNEIINKIGGMN